jgi:hypothetical protein
MADVLTTGAVLDDSLVELMDQEVIVSGAGINKIDAFVEYPTDIDGKSMTFTIYSKLAVATTALTDGTDVDAVAMADTSVVVTPSEYGNAITVTKLADLQTGGKGSRAAGKLTGINVSETTNALGVAALEGGTNTTAAATPGTTAKADLRAAYTRLADKKIPKINGYYVAYMNPAQVSDIKDDYISIAQNTNLDLATNGVVATYEGFLVVEDADATAGKVSCFGMGAIGRGASAEPELKITGPFDKLGRNLNIGWHGVLDYVLVDDSAVEIITGA